jgi:NADH dehydrogenase FAD-containing subunit
MRIVIVGGGFAGVKAALEISKRNLGNVTLISDEDHFLHHATLYATATGRSLAESVVPLTELFAGDKKVTVVNTTSLSLQSVLSRRSLVSTVWQNMPTVSKRSPR